MICYSRKQIQLPFWKATWQQVLRDTKECRPSDSVILPLGLSPNETVRYAEMYFLYTKMFIMVLSIIAKPSEGPAGCLYYSYNLTSKKTWPMGWWPSFSIMLLQERVVITGGDGLVVALLSVLWFNKCSLSMWGPAPEPGVQRQRTHRFWGATGARPGRWSLTQRLLRKGNVPLKTWGITRSEPQLKSQFMACNPFPTLWVHSNWEWREILAAHQEFWRLCSLRQD